MTILRKSDHEFYNVLSREAGESGLPYPGFVQIQRDARRLRQLSQQARRMVERECNGVIGPDGHSKWDDADQARADRCYARIEREATEIVARYGATVQGIGGDPRGFGLYLILPSKRYNSMGGVESGWGVE